jgi:stearoyl-CoA desaturase (delta-9 desaturase)
LDQPDAAQVRHPHAGDGDEFHDDIIYPSPVPFVLVHLACIGAIWSGVTTGALVLCGVLYLVRMFGVTAGYHRYFSHRTYKTSRAFQFVLALVAQSTTQKGVMWWAAKHRHHHKHADLEDDVHSPRLRGFWYSHLGWIFDPKHDATDLDAVPDLARYPELVWLHRYEKLPAVVLAVLCFVFGGWPGLVVGFFWSTVLVYHGTFMINSLAHVHGKQRYVTGDDSRNNWWLAILTLGEGWHNNHHAYMASTRQGFRWYEYDPTYYVLRAMSWARLVWDLNEPPEAIVRNEKKLGRGVVDKVARQLAATFPVERISAQVREAWSNTPGLPSLDELRLNALSVRANAELAVGAALAEMDLPQHLPHLPQMPHLPSVEEVRRRAEAMLAHTPSMDEIVERARQMVVEAVRAQLLRGQHPAGGAHPTA